MQPLETRLRAVQAAITGVRLSHGVGPLAAIVAVLGGFGAVAVAVAPQVLSEQAPVVQRQVIEELAGDDVRTQVEALAQHTLELRRSGLTRAGDSVPAVLRRLDVQDLQAIAALARDETLREALGGGAGRFVQARSDRSGRLIDLIVNIPSEVPGQLSREYVRLTYVRAKEGAAGSWAGTAQPLPLQVEIRRVAGVVRSSFQAAARETGLPAAVATQMTELFGSEAQPQREPARGERFAVVYEALLADGEPVAWTGGSGRVLAAERGTGTNAQQVMWFQEPDSAGAYYDAKGRPLPQGFMIAPLEFDRVTSGFAMRINPILRREQAHNGVDYAAPIGTPVHSVAPGVVEFAGRQSGYGNVVEVRHSADRTTLYAHLDRIDVAQGDNVTRGRMVGTVGRTGWATGPHLHFEYRVAGVHQDPELATRSLQQAALTPASRRLFEQAAQRAGVELAVAQAASASSRRASFE